MSATRSNQSARDRVVAAAAACFASKGYAATTITDIEAAAGLSPGCGGTYRHFASKREMLEAVVDDLLSDAEVAVADDAAPLDQVGFDALALLDRNRDARRLLFADLDAFPELRAQAADRLVERSYRVAADRAAAALPDRDTDAIAAVMVGALFSFRVAESLLGHPPLQVSDERFIRAWTAAFDGALQAPGAA